MLFFGVLSDRWEAICNRDKVLWWSFTLDTPRPSQGPTSWLHPSKRVGIMGTFGCLMWLDQPATSEWLSYHLFDVDCAWHCEHLAHSFILRLTICFPICLQNKTAWSRGERKVNITRAVPGERSNVSVSSAFTNGLMRCGSAIASRDERRWYDFYISQGR